MEEREDAFLVTSSGFFYKARKSLGSFKTCQTRMELDSLLQETYFSIEISRIIIFSSTHQKDQLFCFSTKIYLDNQPAIKLGSHQSSLIGELYCMVMRINLDCNSCCRKMRRVLLRMKEIETHSIEKQENMVMISGRFIPADVAIKIRKKMNRRVEILEILELSNVDGPGPVEEMPQPF
ncbi:hypothetical protein ACS0TY_033237 [Phlomoides rotata]